MVKYLSFDNPSFALRYSFWCKWQGHNLRHPLLNFGFTTYKYWTVELLKLSLSFSSFPDFKCETLKGYICQFVNGFFPLPFWGFPQTIHLVLKQKIILTSMRSSPMCRKNPHSLAKLPIHNHSPTHCNVPPISDKRVWTVLDSCIALAHVHTDGIDNIFLQFSTTATNDPQSWCGFEVLLKLLQKCFPSLKFHS
jgi:hypothetical protein